MTKSVWSVPCWYFFHGFAARIDDNFYKANYIQIWKDIYRNMCYNLPCSICKGHATRYISNVKLTDINTKEKLINYLFIFHNSVNRRLGKRIYLKENLVKYNRLKMKQCYLMVHRSFTLQYFGLFNGWQRKQGIEITTKYLTKIWNNIN
jgi:hypothetical protein